MQIINVGVVGFCPPTKFDEDEACRLIREAYNDVARENPKSAICIVSGLTNVGVLKIAYEEASRRGWSTGGIACKRALEHELYPVSWKIVTGENWGDESKTFLSQIEILIRVGGGPQSMSEVAQARAEGKIVYEYNLPAL